MTRRRALEEKTRAELSSLELTKGGHRYKQAARARGREVNAGCRRQEREREARMMSFKTGSDDLWNVNGEVFNNIRVAETNGTDIEMREVPPLMNSSHAALFPIDNPAAALRMTMITQKNVRRARDL